MSELTEPPEPSNEDELLIFELNNRLRRALRRAKAYREQAHAARVAQDQLWERLQRADLARDLEWASGQQQTACRVDAAAGEVVAKAQRDEALADARVQTEYRMKIQDERDAALAEVKKLRAHAEELASALSSAIDLSREGWGYAPEYFCTKWECLPRHVELDLVLENHRRDYPGE